jgi:hypothetical protein
MGGYGSGRWGWHGKKTQVEECIKWRIVGLKNYLNPGHWGTTRWMIGERESGSISFRVLEMKNPKRYRSPIPSAREAATRRISNIELT